MLARPANFFVRVVKKTTAYAAAFSGPPAKKADISAFFRTAQGVLMVWLLWVGCVLGGEP
jgi:hypothetical protein